jgi:hypothetical protein
MKFYALYPTQRAACSLLNDVGEEVIKKDEFTGMDSTDLYDTIEEVVDSLKKKGITTHAIMNLYREYCNKTKIISSSNTFYRRIFQTLSPAFILMCSDSVKDFNFKIEVHVTQVEDGD